ncbi:caspase family protein [Pseudophaeobacter sp.]|uniref:caspase family protein n=1 Tax=Pseudophaeobacter sp. TaxID=1971739 RepID=UPI00405A0159
MQKRRFFPAVPGLLAVLILALGSLMAQAAPKSEFINSGEKRVAMVIGVSDYLHTDGLTNTGTDAEAMSAALLRLGFDVIKLINPSYRDLRNAELDFVDKLINADVAVFYYAGHSIQMQGGNYLIPRDAEYSSVQTFRDQTFELARLANRMDQLAKTKILILDACRNNPFIELIRTKAAERGIDLNIGLGLAQIASLVDEGDLTAQEFETYGTIVSYAAAPGAVALDGLGRHSPYTAALLNRIEEPGLEVGQLFRQVAADVIKTTHGLQKPEYLVKLSNEFYFSNPEAHQCDILAADPLNNANVDGVGFDLIDAPAAIAACRVALSKAPGHARYSHNLARALDADGQFAASIPHYRTAADQGYIHAINNLGVMYINGLGVEQDFAQGTALLKRARARGNNQARVNLQGTDFSVLMGRDEFRKVQQRLARLGIYDGALDGDFGPRSRAALKDFTSAKGFADNGLTLETLDGLELVEIIPNFELN